MKNLILIALAVTGIVLLPRFSSAQAVGKPSCQSLLAKNNALQAQIDSLQAQVRCLQSGKLPAQGSAPSRPRLYEFSVAPIANPRPLIVPRLSNIPDSRVVLLGTNH